MESGLHSLYTAALGGFFGAILSAIGIPIIPLSHLVVVSGKLSFGCSHDSFVHPASALSVSRPESVLDNCFSSSGVGFCFYKLFDSVCISGMELLI